MKYSPKQIICVSILLHIHVSFHDDVPTGDASYYRNDFVQDGDVFHAKRSLFWTILEPDGPENVARAHVYVTNRNIPRWWMLTSWDSGLMGAGRCTLSPTFSGFCARTGEEKNVPLPRSQGSVHLILALCRNTNHRPFFIYKNSVQRHFSTLTFRTDSAVLILTRGWTSMKGSGHMNSLWLSVRTERCYVKFIRPWNYLMPPAVWNCNRETTRDFTNFPLTYKSSISHGLSLLRSVTL